MKTERYLSLRDELMKSSRRLFASRKVGDDPQDFWALRDVSFTVQQGEAVGIIGRNGAGKSTLLKILSQITPPTEGKITMRGRVASLLEVGTGFHPELTGRENVYLNGAILGMTRAEIKSKFDEIVAFAEIDKFLDTPVKRYSSGMYVRLAFAVAAHLEPEILVVDEVLSVGDAIFQKKCLGKMGDVANSGRTVLFVSHNMAAVKNLCVNGILLSSGTILSCNNIEHIISQYMAQVNNISDSKNYQAALGQLENGETIRILKVNTTYEGKLSDHFITGGEININVSLLCSENLCGSKIILSFVITSNDGIGILHCVSRDAMDAIFEINDSILNITATIKNLPLYPGNYVINEVWVANEQGQTLVLRNPYLSFTVLDTSPHLIRVLGLGKALIHIVPQWSSKSERVVSHE